MSGSLKRVYPTLNLEVVSGHFQINVSKLCYEYFLLLSGQGEKEKEEEGEEKSLAYNFISAELSENLLYCSCYEDLLEYSEKKGSRLSSLTSKDLVFNWNEFKRFFYFYFIGPFSILESIETVNDYYEAVNNSRRKKGQTGLSPELFVEFMEFCLATLREVKGFNSIKRMEFAFEESQGMLCSDPETFRFLSKAIAKTAKALNNSHNSGIFCFIERSMMLSRKEESVSAALGEILSQVILEHSKDLTFISNEEEPEKHFHFLEKFAVVFNEVKISDENFWGDQSQFNSDLIESDSQVISNKYELNARLMGQQQRISGLRWVQPKPTITFYLASLDFVVKSVEVELLAEVKVELSKGEFPSFGQVIFTLGGLTSRVNEVIAENNSSTRINELNVLYSDSWYQQKDPESGEVTDDNRTGEPIDCNILHLNCLELMKVKAPKSFYEWFDAIAEEVFKNYWYHSVVLHFDKFDKESYKKLVKSCDYSELIHKSFKTESSEVTLGDSDFVNSFGSVVAILTIATGKKFLVQGVEGSEPLLIEKKLLHIFAVDDSTSKFGNCCTADIRFHLRAIHNLHDELSVIQHYNALTNSNTLSLGMVRQNSQQSLDITGCGSQLYSKFVSVKEFESNLEVNSLQFPTEIMTSETRIPSFFTACLSATLTPYKKFTLFDFSSELDELISESRKLAHPNLFYSKDIDHFKGKVCFKKPRFRIIPVMDYLQDLVTSLELQFFDGKSIEQLKNYDKVLIGQMLMEDYSLSEEESLKALGELTFFSSNQVRTFKFSNGEFTGTFSEAFDWIQSTSPLIFKTFDEYYEYLTKNRTFSRSKAREVLEETIMKYLAPLNNETSLEQLAYTLCIFLMQACVKDYNSFVFLQEVLVLEDTEAEEVLGEESGRKYRKPLYLGFMRTNEKYEADPFVTDELQIDKITPEMNEVIDLQIAQSESTSTLCACPPVILDEFFEWYCLASRGDGLMNVDLTGFMSGYPHVEEAEECIELEDGSFEMIPKYDVYIKSRVYSQKILESICLHDEKSELYEPWELRMSYEGLGEWNPYEECPEGIQSITGSAPISNPYSLWAKASTFFDTGFTQYFYSVLAHERMKTLGDEQFTWDKSCCDCLSLDWSKVSISSFSQVPVIHSMIEEYCLIHSKNPTHFNLKLPRLWREFFTRKFVSPSVFRSRKVLVPSLYVGSINKFVEESRPRMTYFSLRELKLFKNVRACGDATSNFKYITLLNFKQPISDLEVDFKSLSIDEVEKESIVEETHEFSV